jgi:hypothetical protein
MNPDEFAASQQVAYQEDDSAPEQVAPATSAEPGAGDSRIWTKLKESFGAR